MRSYLARRLALVPVVVLGVATLVFALIHLIPGDPIEAMLGESARPAEREELRRALGLDRPWPVQYGRFLGGLARADLGTSYRERRPVARMISERYGATLELALVSLAVAIAIALPLGALAAVRRGTALDHGSRLAALLGISIPHFWLGPLLILAFSIRLDWLPVSGREGPASIVLPAITLGTALAAILTRMVRSSLLEVLREDYVRTARAKGLAEPVVVLKHALRNSLIPIVTLVGLQFGSLLAGAIITEKIFAWPGVGLLTFEAIQARDYPLVQGCVLAIAVSYVLVNLATDLVYSWIDPRIRYGR